MGSIEKISKGSHAMMAEERRQKLSEVVIQRGYVSLPDLVSVIGVSESTVRRDLDYLHEAGVVRRTHGGAMAVGERMTSLPAFEERSTRQAKEKKQIAQRMAEIIQDGETILLDGGTTTFEVAKQLLGRSLQVVTNSLPIANLLGSSRDIDLVLIGGYVYPKTGVALGPIAQRAIQDLHVKRLVMIVGGATQRGHFNGNLLLVETERAMMRMTQETKVVADNTKFGQQALAFLSDWSAVRRVVVDDGMTDEKLGMIAPNVEVVRAGDRDGQLSSTEER
jgi:DeoR/GlpR family transcriptional regulator of sugar metabolism